MCVFVRVFKNVYHQIKSTDHPVQFLLSIAEGGLGITGASNILRPTPCLAPLARGVPRLAMLAGAENRPQPDAIGWLDGVPAGWLCWKIPG